MADHVFGFAGLPASLGHGGQLPGVWTYGPICRTFSESALHTSSRRSVIRCRTTPRARGGQQGGVCSMTAISWSAGPLTHRIPAYAYAVGPRSHAPRTFKRGQARNWAFRQGRSMPTSKAWTYPSTLEDGPEYSWHTSHRPLAWLQRRLTAPTPCSVGLRWSWPKAPESAHPRSTFCHVGGGNSLSAPATPPARWPPDRALAGVKQLVLTHLSRGYVAGQCLHPEDLLEEARRQSCATPWWQGFLKCGREPRLAAGRPRRAAGLKHFLDSAQRPFAP